MASTRPSCTTHLPLVFGPRNLDQLRPFCEELPDGIPPQRHARRSLGVASPPPKLGSGSVRLSIPDRPLICAFVGRSGGIAPRPGCKKPEHACARIAYAIDHGGDPCSAGFS